MRTRPVKQFYLERLHRRWKQAQFERAASEQESQELYERLLEHLEVFYQGRGSLPSSASAATSVSTSRNLIELCQLDHQHKQTLMELIRTVRQNPTLLTEELPLKVVQENSDRLLRWMARLFPSSKGPVEEVLHSMVGRMMMAMTTSPTTALKGNAKNQVYRLMELYLSEGPQPGCSWYAEHLTPRLEPVIREILFAPTIDAHKASTSEEEQFVVWVLEALQEAVAHMPLAMTRIFRSLLVEEGQDVDEIVIDNEHLLEAIQQPRPFSIIVQFFWWKVIGGLFQQPTKYNMLRQVPELDSKCNQRLIQVYQKVYHYAVACISSDPTFQHGLPENPYIRQSLESIHRSLFRAPSSLRSLRIDTSPRCALNRLQTSLLPLSRSDLLFLMELVDCKEEHGQRATPLSALRKELQCKSDRFCVYLQENNENGRSKGSVSFLEDRLLEMERRVPQHSLAAVNQATMLLLDIFACEPNACLFKNSLDAYMEQDVTDFRRRRLFTLLHSLPAEWTDQSCYQFSRWMERVLEVELDMHVTQRNLRHEWSLLMAAMREQVEAREEKQQLELLKEECRQYYESVFQTSKDYQAMVALFRQSPLPAVTRDRVALIDNTLNRLALPAFLASNDPHHVLRFVLFDVVSRHCSHRDDTWSLHFLDVLFHDLHLAPYLHGSVSRTDAKLQHALGRKKFFISEQASAVNDREALLDHDVADRLLLDQLLRGISDPSFTIRVEAIVRFEQNVTAMVSGSTDSIVDRMEAIFQQHYPILLGSAKEDPASRRRFPVLQHLQSIAYLLPSALLTHSYTGKAFCDISLAVQSWAARHDVFSQMK